MFYCDQEIPWDSLAAEGGVKLATSNRCHLFCDMVTTVATTPPSPYNTDVCKVMQHKCPYHLSHEENF